MLPCNIEKKRRRLNKLGGREVHFFANSCETSISFDFWGAQKRLTVWRQVFFTMLRFI